jgi:hypothetical protein
VKSAMAPAPSFNITRPASLTWSKMIRTVGFR